MHISNLDPLEVYSVEITDKGFNFTIKEVFYKFIFDKISAPDAIATLSEIPKTNIHGLVIFHILLPFMNSNRLRTASPGKCVTQISFLLMMIDLFSSKEDFLPEFYLSVDTQLVTIETSYRKGEINGGCSLGVCFSKIARKLLAERYTEDQVIDLCEEAIFNFYFGLNLNKEDFENKKKAFVARGYSGWEHISAVVEKEGIPHFTVPTGNCACLSSNASRFTSDGQMQDHNVDRPSQHLALLAGVVTLWNEVLKPLYQRKL